MLCSYIGFMFMVIGLLWIAGPDIAMIVMKGGFLIIAALAMILPLGVLVISVFGLIYGSAPTSIAGWFGVLIIIGGPIALIGLLGYCTISAFKS